MYKIDALYLLNLVSKLQARVEVLHAQVAALQHKPSDDAPASVDEAATSESPNTQRSFSQVLTTGKKKSVMDDCWETVIHLVSRYTLSGERLPCCYTITYQGVSTGKLVMQGGAETTLDIKWYKEAIKQLQEETDNE